MNWPQYMAMACKTSEAYWIQWINNKTHTPSSSTPIWSVKNSAANSLVILHLRLEWKRHTIHTTGGHAVHQGSGGVACWYLSLPCGRQIEHCHHCCGFINCISLPEDRVWSDDKIIPILVICTNALSYTWNKVIGGS
jgi:hypothetical protein